MGDLGLGDITGANAGSIIGADNGGGLHVIFDGGWNRPERLFRRRWRRARHRDAGIPRGRGLDAHRGGLGGDHRRRARASKKWYRRVRSPALSRTIRPRDRARASQTNGLDYRNQPIEAGGLPAGAEKAGSGPVCVEGQDLSHGGTGRDDVSHSSIRTRGARHTTVPAWRRSTSPTTGRPCRRSIRRRIPAGRPGRSRSRRRERRDKSDHRHQRHRAQCRAPFDAISRISGDRTQGLVGADGARDTGLTPGVKYVIYIDQLGAGGFSTHKAILLGPEENWNAGETVTRDRRRLRGDQLVLRPGRNAEHPGRPNGIEHAPGFTTCRTPCRSNCRPAAARPRPLWSVPVALLGSGARSTACETSTASASRAPFRVTARRRRVG